MVYFYIRIVQRNKVYSFTSLTDRYQVNNVHRQKNGFGKTNDKVNFTPTITVKINGKCVEQPSSHYIMSIIG